MAPQHWVELFAIVFCFILAGLASGTETALTSVGRLRVRYLAEEGSRAARILQRLQRDPNRFLSTVLLINTMALIIASSSTTLLTDDLFTRWGVPAEQRLWLPPGGPPLPPGGPPPRPGGTPQTLFIPGAVRRAPGAAGAR